MAEKQAEQVISEEPEKLQGKTKPSGQEPSGRAFLTLGLTALGVVFGDIGTSPLYALRVCFLGHSSISPTPENVLGVLSLIFWSLMIVISVKYLLYVFRADNGGEGGILALMALVSSWERDRSFDRWFIATVGVFGAALLYGDGMITPAISVLSAVEGLQVATAAFHRFVVPITIGILVLLFLFQKRGTAGIGSVFGSVMVLWFLTLAILGIAGILRQPQVIESVNPIHGARFFLYNGLSGFLVLGAVFLVVTGGEALYADLGHFTRRTIRFAWFALVLPALLLNYFGQGALLLGNPNAVTQPFYQLVPGWALYPMVLLATMATVIASQAVISGAFSLTRQAVFLGLLPRMRLIQTSSKRAGQIYIPGVNWVLMIATVWLVLGFKKSSGLAAAYGIAVSTTMVITTVITYVVAQEKWGWGLLSSVLVTTGFLMVDLAFFGANMFRVKNGGWIPLTVAWIIFLIMFTWKRGRTLVGKYLATNTMSLDDFVNMVSERPPTRVPGTSVFMSGNPLGAPSILLRHLECNQILHEQVILLTVIIEDVPRVWPDGRMEIKNLGLGIFRVVLHFGFMQNPDVPEMLRKAQRSESRLDLGNFENLTYYVGGQILIPTGAHSGMALWREKLFAFMSRNAAQATPFYGLPSDRVIQFGIEIEL
ncbi:MAG: potassium transporter Kup [Desulfobacterales bacterium]